MSYESLTKEELIEEINQLKLAIEAKDSSVRAMEGSCELRQVFDTVANGIRVIDRDFNTLRVNKTFAEFCNLSEEEVLKRKCFEVFKSDCCHTPDCTLTRILNGEEQVECEVTKVNASSQLVHCLLTTKPLYGQKGEVIGIVEDFRDISLLKESQLALQQSEAKFKSYIDKSPDGIFIVDRKGNFVDVNPAGCQLIGHRKDELIGLNMLESGIFNIQGDLETLIQRTAQVEVLCNRKDGSQIVVDARSVCLGNGLYIGYLRDITERKLMEKALRDSEKKFRSYIDKCPDGIFVIDRLGNYVQVNPAGCEFLGYTEDEMLQKHVSEIAASKADHFKLLKEKGLSNGELDLYKKDGSIVTVDLHAADLGNGHYIGFKRDFSERKRAEMALRDSERKFRSYVNESPDGVLILDEMGRYLEVNPAACSLFGYSEEEFLEFSINDTCFSESLEIFKRLKAEGTIEAESKARKKDGTIITFDVRAVALGDDRYLVFLRDISNRKKAEETLKQSETQLNLILQAISDFVVLYGVESDTEFRVLKINDNCLKALGLTEDQVLGKLIQEVLPLEVANQLIEHDSEAVKTGKAILAKEVTYPFGNFESNFIPIVDHEGKCKHLVVTARDVSTKKKMEEHALKIEKLESVGLLAGGIAHDFNNILTVINGNISLARLKLKQEKTNGVQVDELLTEVEKASLQARNLTQQLLTFAKGGAPILKTSTINEVLKDSVGFALRGSNVRCDFSIPEGLWPVQIDEGQISQVLNNLIINADHAMPDGGVIQVIAENISITGQEPLPLIKGNYVKISIKDQGIGIPKEYLNKVFDPYFTTKQKGNGLGLTTAYSIINKHKGCMLVESKLGQGTVFDIYLPASEEEIKSHEVIEYEDLSGSGRVLVMDDEEMVRLVLQDMLTHMGYEVVCVRDGSEAIDKWKKSREDMNPFDILIMDLTIPGGKGGKETIRELLKLDPKVKAIVASGYSNDRVMANYREYGFKGIISKPFNMEELSQTIKEVIRQGSAVFIA